MQIEIGIDPDTEASGVCEAIGGKLTLVCKMPLPILFEYISEHIKSDNEVVFNIEWITKAGPLFGSKVAYIKKLPKHKREAAAGKLNQDVGKCKGIEIQLTRHLESIGGNYQLITPLKGFLCKVKAPRFKRLTGWTGRSNQEMRDAGMLLYSLGHITNKASTTACTNE